MQKQSQIPSAQISMTDSTNQKTILTLKIKLRNYDNPREIR
jgi:hypothetical protein